MLMMRKLAGFLRLLAAWSACGGLISCGAGAAAIGAGGAGSTKPATTGGAAAMTEGAPREPLEWAALDAATFARAKAERRFIVMDGAAEWCHWCHVMEATTYHDPAVAQILRERFIAVKVDVDARPDIEERYVDYGWPATVIFSPDGEELGKFKGFIEPDRFVEILRAVASGPARPANAANAPTGEVERVSTSPLSEEHLAWIARLTELELDEYYDKEQGGFGHTQKAPLSWDNAYELEHARDRALFTLAQQRGVFDPVWGGVYQYSASTDWNHPHFEKLMTVQAGAIDNYAAAYALTKDTQWLANARSIAGYVDGFMKSAAGGFYTTQDADLNAHERDKKFVDGHVYYALGDKERRALGVPRIDMHEYGKENGLVIAAYATLYQATGDASVLATAERAAARIVATHATSRGGLSHDARGEAEARVLFLADNAAMAWGFVRLYEATKRVAHLEAARRLVAFMQKELGDAAGGGFFGATADPNAVGVFAIRRKPFEDNVLAARVMARIARATHERSPASDDAEYRAAIAGTLRAVATPDQIKARGRMLGDFLLALEETKGVR
jgi:uncharacterized protein YyaL (SSP411 family)